MDLIAPVGATLAARSLPMPGDGALSAGETVQARVTRVDGDVVQLRLGDQTVSVASRVPLTLGQQVSLLVEESSAGKMLLRLVDDKSGKNRAGRTESSGAGRGTNTGGPGQGASTASATPGGRQTPFASLLGLSEREVSASTSGQVSWGGEPDWSGAGESDGRTGNPPGQGRAAGPGATAGGTRQTGQGAAGNGAGIGTGSTGRGAGVGNAAGGEAADGSGSTGVSGSDARSPILNPIGPRPQATPGSVGSSLGTGPSAGAGASFGAETTGGARMTGQQGATPTGFTPARSGTFGSGAGGSVSGGPSLPGWPGQGNSAGGAAGRPWAPGLANLMSAALGNDPLATMLFEALDGTTARLAGTGRGQPSDPGMSGQTPRFPAPGSKTGAPSSTTDAPASTRGGTTNTSGAPTSATGRPTWTTPQAGVVAAGSAQVIDKSPSGAQMTSAQGSTRQPAADRGSAGQALAGQGLAARTAMPAYGRLAQSVGGSVAFGQLLAALPREIGETLARAPLAPADLGRLLIEVGVHPDEMNAVLVGELLSQGVPVQEGSVRSLRRELTAAGGSLRDAAPAVALARLGLPITPLSLAIARQLQAGQLDPPAAWGELLPELQELARSAGHGSQAGALASELLADWRVPVHGGADAIAAWLKASIDRLATPLESKLVRSLTPPASDQVPARGDQLGGGNDLVRAAGAQPQPGDASDGTPGPSTALQLPSGERYGPAVTPGQDIRARLDLLGQALPLATRGEHESLSFGLQRLQATVQAEQILNGASVDRAEPRFFAVTLPTVMERQNGTLQIRVRERDSQPRRRGDAARPDVVQLKLNLPGLGDLGVNLTIGQQSVACHFAAATSFTEALLNASSGELVNRLKRLGFANPAVDAAREAPESAAPMQAAVPRVGHVDLSA